MSHKLVSVILGVVALVLLGLSAFLYLNSDRTGPTIKFGEAMLTYTEGEDEEVLLEGVTAYDEEDGDVTDSLVIENIVPFSDGETAKVVYVAKDSSNNVTKEQRIVNYIPTDAPPVKETEEETDEEEGEDADESVQASADSVEDESETEEETDDPNADEILNKDDEELVSTGAPVIRLTHKKVTLNVGESFNYLQYVEMVDDVDTVSTLSTRLHVEMNGATYPSNMMYTPGTYELDYYVYDTSGNISNVETLTVVVR